MTAAAVPRAETPGLEGARVLVTGGGTGIGRATARRFATLGAHVAVLGRTRQTLEETVREMRGLGVESTLCVADIRDQDAITGAFAELDSSWGGVDILINNAGGQFPKLAIDMSINAWRSVVDLNLTGTFICSRAFAASVVARRKEGAPLAGKTIVNVSTAAAIRPSKGLAHAASARAGVIAMTRALALEWAEHGITVNCVAPGMVDTSGLVEAELHGDASIIGRLAASYVPLKRACTPEEVAAMIAFMASPACAYMTGETILQDGGYALGPGIHIDRDGNYV